MMKGFTLVELLVVISIIAILSVIGITVFTNVQVSARDTKRREDLAALQNAIRQYSLVNHSFPSGTCSTSSTDGTDWPDAFKSALEPTYIQKVPVDPLNGQVRCSGFTCIYCFTPNMWCSDTPPDAISCSAGVANFWTYQENCAPNLIGDSARFKYGCSHYMKSIDPL